MGRPICPTQGIAFAFPDVCMTPSPGGPPVPIPYPNLADLSAATGVADRLLLGPGKLKALLAGSGVAVSSGNEGGTAGGGMKSGKIKGEMQVISGSATVLYGGAGLARFGDPTEQNGGNAQGSLMGAFPSVLVGG